MKSQIRQLGKDTMIYGFGEVIAKSIGFFLLPVYTRIFSPSDYGTIEMLAVLNSFVGSILVMGMDSAQSFYFYEQKTNGPRAQAKVVSAILQWRICWGAVIVAGATFISPLMNRLFFDGRLSWDYFALVFAGSFFSQIMIQSAEVFRLRYKPGSYISIILIQNILSATIALIMILQFDSGIAGYFWGALAGAFTAAILGWWRLRTFLDLSGWHKDWWPRLLKFGAPLVPAGLTMYILNTSDRWFVSHFNGPIVLGYYAVGAKFAMLLSMAVLTFRRAWWPIAMDAIHSYTGKELFNVISKLYLGIGIAIVVLLTTLSPYLIRWMAAPGYFPAYPIVGVLSWSAIFYGFYLFSAVGIWQAEKTAYIPILMGSAALLNIGLNALLVPRFAGLGAAIGTSLSFFAWSVLTLMVSEKLWRVGYDYGIMLTQIGVGLVSCCLILILYEQEASTLSIWLTCLLNILILFFLSMPKKHFHKVMDRANLRF
jgi:O-antigen/teichoic acid export membrane protein